MLEKVMEKPTLSELLTKAIDKQDLDAARKFEAKLDLMQRHHMKNLAGRVNKVVGFSDPNP